MNYAARVLPFPTSDTRYFGPAVLTENEEPDGHVSLRLGYGGPGQLLTARVAVPRTRLLVAGEQVLVGGDPEGDLYVVGVLTPIGRDAPPPTSLQLKAGAYATVDSVEPGGDERLQVHSARNELLFEYDPTTERMRVNVSKGSLELSAEDGDINLTAARAVRIGGTAIELTGHKLDVKTKHTRWIVDRLETFAGTLVETAKNAYRSVEQLAQLKTGRMRTFVDETYQFKSKNAILKADEDFKVKGDQIHLG